MAVFGWWRVALAAAFAVAVFAFGVELETVKPGTQSPPASSMPSAQESVAP
jgi:hypothetical protein